MSKAVDIAVLREVRGKIEKAMFDYFGTASNGPGIVKRMESIFTQAEADISRTYDNEETSNGGC